MRCIFIIDEAYEVKTHWGWFRLDHGAYQDYLAGRLWITWTPGKRDAIKPIEENLYILPPNVTEEAVRLRDAAAKRDICFFLRERFPGAEVEIPYRARMKDIPIDEMSLTVRSSNGLMRAGAKTFGALHELLLRENGLRSVRNLGQKSEQEILHSFFNGCYAIYYTYLLVSLRHERNLKYSVKHRKSGLAGRTRKRSESKRIRTTSLV